MLIFTVGLVLSGVTAFPLHHELRLLATWTKAADGILPDGLIHWIDIVSGGLEHTYTLYPWVAYGTDWLAFAHIVIAMFFIGPLRHPQTSRANIHVGILACLAVIPLAIICGPIRGIPFYWQLIDCSFGIIGIIPLVYCLSLLRHIEACAAPSPPAMPLPHCGP